MTEQIPAKVMAAIQWYGRQCERFGGFGPCEQEPTVAQAYLIASIAKALEDARAGENLWT